VFPGGIVDPGDREAQALVSGLDDESASQRLGLAEGGLAFYVAAVRECFEESGLLYAERSDGSLLPTGADAWQRLAGWREPLHRGERTLAELCESTGLKLAVNRLSYLSHWVTPLGRA